MNDECGGRAFFGINKKDNHLAIAIFCSMIRTGAIRMCQSCHLQVERLHNTEAGAGQLLICPNLNLPAGLIED